MTFSDTALRAALRLYPAAYRRERADELSAVFADTTAGAGRVATTREAFDLGVYGLRLRTGLTATGVTGRAVAMAAPFAVGAATGPVAWSALATWHDGLSDESAVWLVWRLTTVLPLISLVAMLFGSWKPARRLALPAVLAVPLVALAGTWLLDDSADFGMALRASVFALPSALWSLTVPAAPADLLGRVTARHRIVALVAVLFGLGVTVVPGLYRIGAAGAVSPALLLVAGVAVLAVAGVRRGQALPLALLVAVLPLLVSDFAVGLHGASGPGHLLPLVAVLVLAGVAVGLRLMPPAEADGPAGKVPLPVD
jgi:hypothetical protein